MNQPANAIDFPDASDLPDVLDSPEARDETIVHVISDIQGRLDHLRHGFEVWSQFRGPELLMVVGDVTDNGTEEQWTEVMAALSDQPGEAAAQTAFCIGNHEFYNDTAAEQSIDRYARYTGAGVYGRVELAGADVVRLGTQYPTDDHDVTFAADQWQALDEAIAARRPGLPLLVFTHHPLPNTVSGTRPDQAWGTYVNDHEDPERLRRTLIATASAEAPVLLISGHTHWRVDRDDWAVALAPGCWAINCGAVMNSFGPSSDNPSSENFSNENPSNEGSSNEGTEILLDEDDHSGTRLTIRGRTVDVEAWDFRCEQIVNRLTI